MVWSNVGGSKMSYFLICNLNFYNNLAMDLIERSNIIYCQILRRRKILDLDTKLLLTIISTRLLLYPRYMNTTPIQPVCVCVYMCALSTQWFSYTSISDRGGRSYTPIRDTDGASLSRCRFWSAFQLLLSFDR
jgi:hypothetical protein